MKVNVSIIVLADAMSYAQRTEGGLIASSGAFLRGEFQKMRIIIAGALLGALALPCAAGEYVNGYVRSNGTYVQPYYRSAPDSTTLNNYSTQGNVNPYTGEAGTKAPTYGSTYQAPTYGYGGGNNLNRR